MKSALQFWKHLSSHLKNRRYKPYPYDPCIVNRFINGSQFTIVWHVDGLKLSQMSEKVIDEEVEWLQATYGPLVCTKGLQHTYFGIDLNFEAKRFQVSMVPYFQEIVDEFPEELGKPLSMPATVYLYEEAEETVLLTQEVAKKFHHTVAKILWGAIHARPDLLPTLLYLTCKVTALDQDDSKKLVRLVSYIKGSTNLPLILTADTAWVVTWWVDDSFALQKNMRSQTGAAMSMGRGCMYSTYRKEN
jgi:hypothetical protein